MRRMTAKPTISLAILAITGLALTGTPPELHHPGKPAVYHLLSVSEAEETETHIVAEHEEKTGVMEELPYEDVEIATPDRFLLYGKLYDPSQLSDIDPDTLYNEADEYVGPMYPLVILLHGMNGTHRDWGDFPALLLEKGYAILALDLRGHGESVYRETGGRISWRAFHKNHWQQAGRDVERIIRYLEKYPEDYPQVDPGRVGLVGAKLGANIAIVAAGRDQGEHIKSVVVLSPGLDYKGLETSFPIIHYKNPIMIIASRQDTYAFESSELLYRWALGAKAIQLYQNVGNSTDMLRNEPRLKTRIINWLVQHFPPKAG